LTSVGLSLLISHCFRIVDDSTGYAFAFGGDDQEGAADTKTFIGTTDFAVVGSSSAFWFFQYTFSATSVTIVAGTLAERCQMVSYLCYSLVVGGFIYPVVAHSVWSFSGFLSNSNNDPFLGSGAIDFAGSGVVHLTGGCIALVATTILGPRRGRFYDAQGEPLETPKVFPGHSVSLQLLGTMVLWFGCKCSTLLYTMKNHAGHLINTNLLFLTANYRVWIQLRLFSLAG
jgi:ammonium transporter, Amt family